MGLLGKISGSSSAKRANKERKRVLKEIEARKQQSLAELSPENIQKLMQMFMTKYGQLMAPSLMNSQQKLSANTAGRGLAGAGLTRSLKAGLPAMYSRAAMEQASPDAFSLASQRAGVIGGTPIPYMPKKSTLADIGSMVASYYGVESPEQRNTGGGGVF